MAKRSKLRYLWAILACMAIFALWIVVQMFVAKGALIGALFVGVMVAVWNIIVK